MLSALRAFFIVLLILGGLPFVAAAESLDAKPNIVVFLADDMGWADVGFNGGDIPTPNIDRIAEAGVILEHFHVQPTCSPTRHAFITGRHPFRMGAHICNLPSHHKEGPPLEERFLSQAIQDAGYYTAALGKWHLGKYRRAYWPTSRGFDMYYGMLSGSLDYFKHTNGPTLDWQELHADGSVWEQPLREEGYATELLGRRAARLIEEHDFEAKPLFIYLAFNAPHTPMHAKPEDIEEFAHVPDRRRCVYSAMMHSMDTEIGRVLDALDARGVTNNTLVLFFNDNGGAHNNGSNNHPLRGGKGSGFEGGSRVPTAMAWPGKIKAGTRFSEVLHVIDLYPTFLGLAGGKTEKEGLPSGADFWPALDGVDFWPALTGKEAFPARDLYQNVADPSGRGILRSGDWKFIAIRADRAPDDSIVLSNPNLHGLLFNIAEDPNETANLAEQHPERVTEMWGKLKARGPEVVSAASYCSRPPEGWQPRPDHSQAED